MSQPDAASARVTSRDWLAADSARAFPARLVQWAASAALATALFIAAGVYASIAGFGLAWAIGIAVALVAGCWVLRFVLGANPQQPLVSGPAPRSDAVLLAVLLLLSVAAAVTLPNDVSNTDAARQVASIEHVNFYQTLLTPGFFLSQGTAGSCCRLGAQPHDFQSPCP